MFVVTYACVCVSSGAECRVFSFPSPVCVVRGALKKRRRKERALLPITTSLVCCARHGEGKESFRSQGIADLSGRLIFSTRYSLGKSVGESVASRVSAAHVVFSFSQGWMAIHQGRKGKIEEKKFWAR